MTGDDVRERFDDASRRHLTGVLPDGVQLRPASVDEYEVVGCYWGFHEDYGRYSMINTVVRRDHQGRGLYTAFLPRLVAAVREVGFREIDSRHRADNNAVLVPKLKAGFVIAGFEIAPRFGILIHLRLYLHAGLGRLFAHRVDGSQAGELRAAGLELP